VAAVFSLKNTTSWYLSLFSLLKLVEFILFYFYLRSYAFKRFGLLPAFGALVVGSLMQAIVGILQFVRQSDLGLRLLGEGLLDPEMRGVAVFYNFAGDKIMRAYGTVPHPNILAGYLFLGMFAFYFIYLYYGHYYKRPNYLLKINTVLLGSYALILLSFFFTFSRVIIFSWFLGFSIQMLIVFWKDDFKKLFLHVRDNRDRIIKIMLVGVIAIVLVSVFYWPEVISRVTISGQDEAVQLRMYYAEESLKAGVNLFGVGIGNFVNWFMETTPNLPRYIYQPVHNIYLLLYSEIGLVGVSLFILFLVFRLRDYIRRTKMLRFYHYSLLVFVGSFLFIGLFDHFFMDASAGKIYLLDSFSPLRY